MPLLSFAGAPHGGRQRLLPEWNSQPRITPTTIIDHSIVGSADGAFAHFLLNTGIESHFIIDLDGEIQQLMNTDREADANLNANRFAISIETADNGDPNHFAWTAEQVDSLIWLHNKLRAVHPTIPRRKCPSEAGGGLGYHTLFGAPSAWTPVAKSCPGNPARIEQWNRVLLPAFLNPSAPPPELPKGDDMFVLRCDPTSEQPARPLRLVSAQRSRLINNNERGLLVEAGVQEVNLTAHPILYDRVLELAEELPAPAPTPTP